MEDLLEGFSLDFKHLVSPSASLALAYSGGVDSTVLLHALHQRGIPLHAVHVNHQIQPAAGEWAVHCERQCRKLGVPLTVLTIQVVSGGAGLEGQARQARYRAIFDWMKCHGHRVLLCAHHLDDQLETVLLQLFRGSGLRGVGGMRSIGPVGVDRHLHPELVLARPLLGCTKESLLDYARHHQLDFVQDPSNSDTSLRRNWVRQVLLPDLKQHFPQSPTALLQLADHFRAHCQAEDELNQAGESQWREPDGSLRLETWKQLDADRQASALRHWLLGHGVRCGRLKLLELVRQLQVGKGGVRQLDKAWRVRVTRGKAHLERIQAT